MLPDLAEYLHMHKQGLNHTMRYLSPSYNDPTDKREEPRLGGHYKNETHKNPWWIQRIQNITCFGVSTSVENSL
jgi:hypothetical protein